VIECLPDANIYDLIIEREGMVEALERLVSVAEIDEQLAKAPRVKRAAIDRVPRRRVPAGVFVFDFARFDDVRLGPGDAYEHVRGAAGLHEVPDAIVAETARNDGLVLVTHDRRLWKRATDVSVAVLNFPAFTRLVGLLQVEPVEPRPNRRDGSGPQGAGGDAT
jgi:predicted nucleic acid-binding protein